MRSTRRNSASLGRTIAGLLLACSVAWPVRADDAGTPPDLAKAAWIWSVPSGRDTGSVVFFRRKIVLPAKPVEASVALTADNGYELYVNDRRLAGKLGYGSNVWSSVERFRIESDLVEGTNVVAIRGEDLGGVAAMVAALYIRTEEGEEARLVSDESWLASTREEPGWTTPDHDDRLWKPAAVVAPMGKGPWGTLSVPKTLTEAKKLLVDRSVPGEYTPPADEKFAQPAEGFRWPQAVLFLRGYISKPHHFAFSWRMPDGRSVSVRMRAYPESDVPGPASPGKQIYALRPASPEGRPALLFDAGGGSLGSPSVSFDGKTVFFSMAPEGEAFYRIYRMSAEGGVPQALTGGPFHDYDPEPLPDGRIVFSSTRIGSREEYHGNLASSLFVMNADGSGIQPLTSHIVADREPKVTAFGSLALVRCDNFLERAKVETNIHHLRLDGTGGAVILGNDRAAIPYQRHLADEGGPNPGWLRANGFGSPAPLPDGRVAALSKDGLVIGGFGWKGAKAVRTGVSLFDISSLPDGRLLCTTLDRRSLGVVDPASGEVFRIMGLPKPELHSVVYLGPRPLPPAMPPTTVHEADRGAPSGYLYCQNVFNTKQKGADLKRIRAVRVYEGRPLALRPEHFPYEHIGVEAVELGAVPLAPDGSFYVRVPADRALAVQAVDAEGRAVINELSWIYVRPGERRSCVGCHSPRYEAPNAAAPGLALRAGPAELLGQGRPHRFRGNNAEVGGVLNLQLDRMREAAALDSFDVACAGRADEVRLLCETLAGGESALRISAAQRLAVLRDPAAAPPLASALKDPDASVRMNAALALAACGNRKTLAALAESLSDDDALVAQAANMALENLTGRVAAFNAFDPQARAEGAAAWRSWLERNKPDAIEADLIARLGDGDPQTATLAVQSLGRIGGAAACAALRGFVIEKEKEPQSDLRAVMAAMRALGHLHVADSVALLADILQRRLKPEPPQRNVYLAAAAAEALGRIAAPEAEKALVDACRNVGDFWLYTGICGDHPVLVANHSSPLHFRLMEALDAVGSRNPDVVPALIRSIPVDVDRGLLPETDSYENLVARVVRRTGLTPVLMETCLGVLGDATAKGDEKYRSDVTTSPLPQSWGEYSKKTFEELLKIPRGGLAFLPYDAETRAAQAASVLCVDERFAPRLLAAFERYRRLEVSAEADYGRARTRAWVCFYLARALGKAEYAGAFDALAGALEKDPTEGSQGYTAPPSPMTFKAITPFYRASAAYALGRLGDHRGVAVLLRTAGNFENALDVRHSAARGLALLCDRRDAPALEAAAKEYPEVATQRILFQAAQAAASRNPKP